VSSPSVQFNHESFMMSSEIISGNETPQETEKFLSLEEKKIFVCLQ